MLTFNDLQEWIKSILNDLTHIYTNHFCIDKSV